MIEERVTYNPTGMYDGSSREAITTFKALLDTAAACGQLAAEAA